eukprot:jgi/Botrbrau1/1782/Bobra.0217s0037.1
MTGFLRPGERSSKAFGVSFESDRDAENPTPVVYNAGERLGLQGQRERLPVAQHRTEILYLVEHHATTILVGETGSGKTTQVPQYLHEAGWTADGRVVACTQPRRVAAMTVAARVAEEMGTAVGQTVGYSIRFEDVSTLGQTRIKYCTDGVLLREMMEDPLLTMYSVVMVDEAHERSVATDLLLGLLKKVQRRRPELRIIISSATLEAERFAAFFDTSIVRGAKRARVESQGVSLSPAILSVEGRTHLIQIHYLEEAAADYVRCAVETAISLHRGDLPGDILIFLTGQEDVERAVEMLHEDSRRLKHKGGLRLKAVPLYAGLPGANQLEAFQPPPRGFRKVVVSTNIAETSVTIEGIVCVIDSCFVKQKVYNPITGLEALLVAPISRAAAVQRAGRAGRMRPGHAFRLCTQEAFDTLLPEATVPEIQRSDLVGPVLQLKALGVDNIMHFDWLAPPPSEAMVRALELLYALGALNDSARLSGQGMKLAELPLDPRLGTALLAAGARGCTQEVLTIAAILSVHSVWYMGGGGRRALDEAKARFAVAEGDLITYLNVWKGWEASGFKGKWCHQNRLNYRTLLRAADIRNQLSRHLLRLGIALESSGEDMTPVRKALASGLFNSAVRFHEMRYNRLDDQSTNVYRMIRNTGGVTVDLRINPASVLGRTAPEYLLFYQVQQGSTGLYDMLDVVTIEPQWLPEVAPHMYHDSRGLLK